MIFFSALAEAALDRASIEALYRSHGHIVLRRARSMLGNTDDAHDAVQQIFMNLLARPETFQGRSKPSTFLYSVTTNHCLTMMRNRGNRQRILDDELAPTSATSSPEVSADSVAVRNALKTVNPELAEVAVYYYFDDLRQEEIATVMGVSRRRVADLLTRMHEALRHLLVPTPATTESP